MPVNFEHQLLLIESQRARREGRHIEAIDLCDRAIVLSRAAELPHDEALANELCGELYLAMGKAKPAGPYLTDAYLGYFRWGATAKAEELAKKNTATCCCRAAGGAGAVRTPHRPRPASPRGRRSCRGQRSTASGRRPWSSVRCSLSLASSSYRR